PNGLDDTLGIIPRFPQILKASLEGVDVYEDHDAPVDSLVAGPVRPDPHGVPVAAPVLDLLFSAAAGADHLQQHLIQVRYLEVVINIGQRPADIGGDQL